MKPLENKSKRGDWHGYNYSELIDSFEYEILFEEEVGEYQGDYVFIFRHEGKFGYLIFGYGSCSGCDSLEAANSIEELESFRQELLRDIKWFDNAQELMEFIKEPPGFPSWWEYEPYTKEIKERMMEKLKEIH
jgi:hypothetical protein